MCIRDSIYTFIAAVILAPTLFKSSSSYVTSRSWYKGKPGFKIYWNTASWVAKVLSVRMTLLRKRQMKKNWPQMWDSHDQTNSNFYGTIRTNLEQLVPPVSFQNLHWEALTLELWPNDPPLRAPCGGTNSNFFGTIRTNLEQLAYRVSFWNSQWGGGGLSLEF